MLINPRERFGGRMAKVARSVVCSVVAVAAVLTAALTFSAAGWRTVVPMAITVVATCVALGWQTRTRVVPAAAVVATVTALGTLIGLSPRSEGHAGLMALVEIAMSLVLVLTVARFAPPRLAVLLGTVLALGASSVLLRVESPSTLPQALGLSSPILLISGVPAVAGGYLRALDARRLRSVHEARRSQRLQLAADLHDFVAHDVSGIVVLAQAAQVVGESQPEQVRQLLRHIEEAGQQALASLDRTVLMLNSSSAEPDAPPAAPGETRPTPYGLPDIAELVDRFRTPGHTEMTFAYSLTSEAVAQVPREVAATAHRTVVEALTNVRRHADSALSVRVSVHTEGSGPDRTLVVSVINSAQAISTASGFAEGRRHGGGTGLAGLKERVAALGGTLQAGPYDDEGWQVLATLPYTAS